MMPPTAIEGKQNLEQAMNNQSMNKLSTCDAPLKHVAPVHKRSHILSGKARLFVRRKVTIWPRANQKRIHVALNGHQGAL